MNEAPVRVGSASRSDEAREDSGCVLSIHVLLDDGARASDDVDEAPAAPFGLMA
jgi:hypothetical protein